MRTRGGVQALIVIPDKQNFPAKSAFGHLADRRPAPAELVSAPTQTTWPMISAGGKTVGCVTVQEGDGLDDLG
jgi:hypothetical protein